MKTFKKILVAILLPPAFAIFLYFVACFVAWDILIPGYGAMVLGRIIWVVGSVLCFMGIMEYN